MTRIKVLINRGFDVRRHMHIIVSDMTCVISPIGEQFRAELFNSLNEQVLVHPQFPGHFHIGVEHDLRQQGTPNFNVLFI